MALQERPTGLPELRASDEERRQAAALLKDACVQGRITLDEFGERTSRVLAARTRNELEEITQDLPKSTALAPSGHRKPVSSTLAVMSASDRTGAWLLGENSRVIAVMGACKLDLRHATISAAVTTIRVRVVMGNVNIIVPEGVDVELDALAIAGARTLRLSGPPPAPGAPMIRIEGFVVMGDLSVRDRDPSHG